MGIIAWVILGGLAGWIASLIMKTDQEQGLFMNIVVGVIGALVGGFIVQLFGGEGVTNFSLYGLLVAIFGSVVLLALVRAVKV